MFNTIINKRTEYIPYEKSVTINRAPTDKSIKLYDETKQKAYDSILHSLSVKDNLVNFKAIYYKDYCSFDYVCSYMLYLNGKEIKGTIKSDTFYKNTNKDYLIKLIYQEVASHLAIELIKAAEKNEYSSLS